MIKLLDKDTINKIAAGEVIDRPSSIVKELMENAIDAGASAITCEIKEGGISLIRITDNGCGFERDEIKTAFLRHATSKLSTINDLIDIQTLGFRGEALSSIAAVSKTELLTKRKESFTGSRYYITAGYEEGPEEVGVPDGTTFLVRDLFYNTPARKKFLKSASTEAGAINDIVSMLCLSHPEISFKFVNNGKTLIYTSGNGKLRDVIYTIYGKETADSLIEVNCAEEDVSITGYVCNPVFCKTNRKSQITFINNRFVSNKTVASAINSAFEPFVMQHRFGACFLFINVYGGGVDVNVHPSKMEVRFSDASRIYDLVFLTVHDALLRQERIVNVPVTEEKKPEKVAAPIVSAPEPFEVARISEVKPAAISRLEALYEEVVPDKPVQQTFADKKFLSEEAVQAHKLVGQVFDTYWIIEYDGKMFIMDQHAAHEKVLYERFVSKLQNDSFPSQMITPPLIVNLSMAQEEMLLRHMEDFSKLGFVIENFGDNDYAISGMPTSAFLSEKDMFLEILDELLENRQLLNAPSILDKLAMAACKAAVKGGNRLSVAEINELVRELLSLENPYNCPHGRPTLISMSRSELERKFKRIV